MLYFDYTKELTGLQGIIIENIERNDLTVFVTSEKMTYGALRAIRDKGLRVPEDISVVGFDIHNMKDDRRQMITSVRQPEDDIGKRVGELLIKCLKDKANQTEKEKILLEPYVENGDTVKRIK